MKINYKKLGWNIAGTLFLLFLLGNFVWNYYARQNATITVNQIIMSVVDGTRTPASILRAAPNKLKELTKEFY